MDFIGSRTEANLMAAFTGEAMARDKYDFYASVARKEGYQHIAAVFDETAGNEREHAKIWFKQLGKLNGTLQNLRDAQAAENYEWTDMYARFEAEAKEEGFKQIAQLFHLVATVEHHHDDRFGALADELEAGEVFKRIGPTRWICMNCGYIYEGTEAPPICPLCAHPQAWFKDLDDQSKL